MAHELEIVNGKANMIYVGNAPWHDLGTKVPETISTAEAIVASGLNWNVGLKELFTDSAEKVTHRATYRQDTGAILGVVGPEYTALQNSDAFSFFDPFLASKEATIQTAGSLKEGRRVWVLAKLNRDPMKIVGEDTVEKYILLSNSHDGTLAVRVGFTPVRVVCQNTMSMAHNDRNSQLIRLSHTKNVALNLEAIREVMDTANARFEATAEQYRLLAQKQINQADLERYVKLVFTMGTVDENAGERKSRVLEPITRLFETGRGNDMAGVAGTYWAAYNAVTEFIQYERGGTASKDSRLNETWFGGGMVLNKKALQTALTLSA
jgi:phage/plasmid-like protein (TIGR03299 family)